MKKNQLISVGINHVVDYPTPANINYFWGFGSLAGVCLGVQLITGIFLAMHQTPHVELAFASVEHIIRDVHYGWLLRQLHANGAGFFFIIVGIHVMRGLYYGSQAQPRGALWVSGVLILILMIATGFIGYVLPWGQISLWGAIVITNLISAIPVVGDSIVCWVWGGFSVDNATLNRFFSLHFTLPFVIAGLAVVHLALLHVDGSNNPLGVDSRSYRLPFQPQFYVKDLFGALALIMVLSFFVFFYPNTLGHPDNYVVANPIVTPEIIVPEFYFLPFQAILRSIPHKLAGVLAMGGALAGLMLLPWINTSEVRSPAFRPVYRKMFWLFVVNFLLLGYLGQTHVSSPQIEIGQLATLFYFFFLFVFIPMSGKLESFLMRN